MNSKNKQTFHLSSSGVDVEVELLLETKIYEQLSQGEGCSQEPSKFYFKEIPEDVVMIKLILRIT